MDEDPVYNMHNANLKSGTKRQAVPFYKLLSHFFTTDRAIATLHMYSITGEGGGVANKNPTGRHRKTLGWQNN